MDRRVRWLWIITVANACVALLLVLSVYGFILALSVLAPLISASPVLALVLLGLLLSTVGLSLTKGVTSRWARLIPRFINDSVLALILVVAVGIGGSIVASSSERFIIPDGYKGDVYVFYGSKDCVPLSNRGGTTYVIPNDGILPVCGTLEHKWTRTSYYYKTANGTLDPIRNFWPSTIHPTEENLSNDHDKGVYFPRSGTSINSSGCAVDFQLFYVGTKRHLLTEYKQTDFESYLRRHPVGCK